ncbi:MAG TPA: tetratricopeptide repeat protein [Anaeromyxobacteraceae bacterium]|nr:tetratricopeptide repeat protein [Anaeromyxobacteraceae bacterium]
MSPRRALALLSLLLAAAGLPGCATSSRADRIEARLQVLEDESEAQQKSLQEQRAAIKDGIEKLDQKLGELNATARRTGADLAVRQDRLEEGSSSLRGQLEEQQQRLGQLDATLQKLKADNETALATLKGTGAYEAYQTRKRAEELARPTEPGPFLALAQKEEAAGDRAVARQLYDELLRRWPKDPRAAEASFRVGELQSGDKRYREAVLSFGKVVQEFPRSERAPDALYRMAETLQQLELKDDARAALQDLVQKYPGTPAAKKAKAKLAELAPPKPVAKKKRKQ